MMRTPRGMHKPIQLILHLLLLCLLSVQATANARETLRILTWPGYADPDLVERFEQRHGVEVQVTYIASDDDMWEKLNANGGADFDLFAVNTAELQRYIDKGLSAALELDNIPNRSRQLERFQRLDSIPGLMRGDKAYAIPFTYSEMGLIYNRDLIREPPRSMASMWDPVYQGQVLAFDTSNHNFTIAGLLTGAANPFQLTDREFRLATRKLVRLRRNVLTFYKSPEEAVKLFQENEIALIFGNYGAQQVLQLQRNGANVGYVMPAEGALAWLDCWAVTGKAKDKRLAEAWIDYTLETAVSQALTERQGLANTITPPPEYLQSSRIIWLEPLEDFARRAALWHRIRSGDTMNDL